MSSWNYVDGTFTPLRVVTEPRRNFTPELIQEPQPQPQSLLSTSLHSHTGDLQRDYWAEVTGTTELLLQRAQKDSECVVGVVTDVSESGVATVAHTGIVFAWVTRGDVLPPLSGIYEKTVNGVFAGNVVIDVHPDRSFTMAQTHDDDLKQLRQRFDALTTAT